MSFSRKMMILKEQLWLFLA